MSDKNGIELHTFLMFSGNNYGKAKGAIEFYMGIFEDSKIKNIEYFEEDSPEGNKGYVRSAEFEIAENKFMAYDCIEKHKFNFTASISFFINFNNEEQMKIAYKKLKENGKELMPLNNYGFSNQFAWVEDEYGVSWQLNLP